MRFYRATFCVTEILLIALNLNTVRHHGLGFILRGGKDVVFFQAITKYFLIGTWCFIYCYTK